MSASHIIISCVKDSVDSYKSVLVKMSLIKFRIYFRHCLITPFNRSFIYLFLDTTENPPFPCLLWAVGQVVWLVVAHLSMTGTQCHGQAAAVKRRTQTNIYFQGTSQVSINFIQNQNG